MPRSCSWTMWSIDGGALVDLADLVGLAGVVEDPLGRRGLARVDVGDDPDVAVALEGDVRSCHCFSSRGAVHDGRTSRERPGRSARSLGRAERSGAGYQR